MTAVYEAACLALAAASVVAAAWGGWAWWAGGMASRGFWLAVRCSQGVAVAAAVLGAVLLLGAGEHGRQLQYAYGLIAAAVSFVAEQLRLTSAETVLAARGYADAAAVGREPEEVQHAVVAAISRREAAVMAAAMGVMALLGLRGAGAI